MRVRPSAISRTTQSVSVCASAISSAAQRVAVSAIAVGVEVVAVSACAAGADRDLSICLYASYAIVSVWSIVCR